MKGKVILKGKNQGVTSIIMAGNHGNEICGINAFKKVLSNLTIESGTVIFVYGNLKAIKQKERFSKGGYNMNRLFKKVFNFSKEKFEEIKKTYEYKRAIILMKIFDSGDALLDIHSTKNQSVPFVVCEKNAYKIASQFPKEFIRIVYGFDKLEPGASDGYMLSKGKIGICIECGQHSDPQAEQNAINAIYSFLHSRGHVKLLFPEKVEKKEIVKMFYLYRTKTDSFTLSRKFYDFEPIAKDTYIGIDNGKQIFSPKDCLIVFAHNCSQIDAEAFFLGEII